MYYQSPIGLLKIIVHNSFINEVNFYDKKNEITDEEVLSIDDQNILEKCTQQFDEYFSGKRKQLDFPIRQEGTPFQQKVWDELLNIPFGKTISYLQLSKRIGNVKSIRAAASANGRNNLSIVVPCHRVIGSNGSLTGYAGGLWRKQWLLEHENKYANGVSLLF